MMSTPVDAPRGSGRPVALLCGLFVGVLTLALSLGYWLFAWIFPLVLTGATVPWQRTREFGLGALAATCGAIVAVVTEWLLIS